MILWQQSDTSWPMPSGTESRIWFHDFAQIEQYGTKVYFAHPYTSWERAQNERHNGLLRRYIPKGVSIENFSEEDILWAADALNSLPRKNLWYCTPEELFEAFLDIVSAAWAAAEAPILVESDASTKTVAKMELIFLPLCVQLELAIYDYILSI